MELCNIMTNELKQLDVWFKVNKLSLNVSKTNYMVFGGKQPSNVETHIFINGVEIDRVPYTEFLGIQIDSRLTWRKHIQNVQMKVAKCVSILYKVKYLFNEKALLMIYSSLILPYLNYCVELWANTYATNLRSIIFL